MDVVPLNDLSRALAAQADLLAEVTARVLTSGSLVHGREHAAFEAELAAFVGAEHGIGLASGTDALELALRAVATPGRDVVVTAANCGGYTTTAARRAGLRVRYVDVRDDALLDPEALPHVLGEDVAAVVATHLYGAVADVAAVRMAAETVGAAVVEDCAQAIGATGGLGRAGGLADIAAYSFYPTKNLGAVGDGGAVTTSRTDLATTVRELRQYGWQGKYLIGRDGGRNSRLDELQAAVLRVRLPLLEAGNERRRAIVAAYAAAASERIHVLHAGLPGHVGHLGVIVTEDRATLAAHLDAYGVQHGIHYPVPDHRQPAFAAEYADVSLPVTERLSRQILTVPVFPELRDDEVERVCAALASY